MVSLSLCRIDSHTCNLYTIVLLYEQGQLTGKRKRSEGDEHMESRSKVACVTDYSPPSYETVELRVCGFTGHNIIECIIIL
jgi:hypothetical protein